MIVGVVGAGIFGMAAALELGRRGHRVLLFEQGRVPYEKAGSTDVAKTIRRLYRRSETYVELAERAARQWRAWEERLGASFYHPVGQLKILHCFQPGTRIYESWQFLTERGAPVQILPLPEARKRYPQFVLQLADTCVFDPWAGYLESGKAVGELARMAREEGIEIREETPVAHVSEGAVGVRVAAEGGPFLFDRVVVAAGAWMRHLIPEVGQHLRVTRQQMAFFQPTVPEPFAPGTMPVWGINPDEEGWYGYPLLRDGFVKVANDVRGEVVEPDSDRDATAAFLAAARKFVARRIPELARGKLVGSRSCLYENTPDSHFIIDWVPGSQRILAAGGGSGHGFKFGGSIGPVIADALEERPNPLGELFRIGTRFRPQ